MQVGRLKDDDNGLPGAAGRGGGMGEIMRETSFQKGGGGQLIAACQRRKDSMIDYGHDADILVQRSVYGGRTSGRQRVLFSERETSCLLSPIIEGHVTNTVIVTFWKLPTSTPHDLKYLAPKRRRRRCFSHLTTPPGSLATFLPQMAG